MPFQKGEMNPANPRLQMKLIHVAVSIPLFLAALVHFWFLGGNGTGLGASSLLFLAATAVALFSKHTPRCIVDYFLSASSPPPTTGVQPEPPIKHLLDVPDLVTNVFEWLDPDSRRAFFQAHPDVAHNSYVLARSKLRVELGHQSLQDLWQRVLRLSRSQPLRCLILVGPDKERLHDFLCCIPEGRHEEKQRVLQGTEVQLQVHIKLENGGAHLQNWLKRWRDEHAHQDGPVWPWVRGDTRVQLVLDFCGRGLVATTEGDLEPCCCTIRNGTLKLLGTCRVKVANDRVCMDSIVIKGAGMQQAVVEVVSGGQMVMEGCHVEGGWSDTCGAVVVHEAGARLCAMRCSLKSSKGSGLVVRDGGVAQLDHVTVSSCGFNGIWVVGQSTRVSAADCHMDGNRWGNVAVQAGGHAHLHQCSCNGSKEWHGIQVLDPGSRLVVASRSSASGNKNCGILCGENASSSVSHATADGNHGYGLYVQCRSSSLVADSSASGNKVCGAGVSSGSNACLSRVLARDNGVHGFYATGQGSRLEVAGSSASSNRGCGVAVFSSASARVSCASADNNGQHGLSAKGPGTSLEATSYHATGNRRGDTAELSGGRIFYVDA